MQNNIQRGIKRKKEKSNKKKKNETPTFRKG